jgi:hypothetical protein
MGSTQKDEYDLYEYLRIQSWELGRDICLLRKCTVVRHHIRNAFNLLFESFYSLQDTMTDERCGFMENLR